jgi:1-aminocyclopropane-1-carboxylate deaminase
VDVFSSISSRLEPLNLPGFEGRLFIKRDDLIHPIVCGNKWRKLKYLIRAAQEQGKNHLVTFGGAYSNHLLATACAGAALGLKTTCFLRADEDIDNHYLFAARLYGMNLIPTDRGAYRDKKSLFNTHFGQDVNAFYVAEGGESVEAELGIAELIDELDWEPDLIVHASATATTASGLAAGIVRKGWKTKVLSVAVLKNAEEQAQKLQTGGWSNVVSVNADYDFGGYAKTTFELMEFIRITVAQTGIMFDPVYTGKALFALNALKPEGKVVFLHTGGTMGIFSEAFMKIKS